MHRVRDVAVIGGGPAGLYTAHLLARDGTDVMVLDSRWAIGEGVVCTGIVSKEAFDRIQFSPASVLNRIQTLRLVSQAGSMLEYTHPEVLAYAVDRYKFDNEIREWAQMSGAEIREESPVKRVTVEKNHVVVSVRSPHGNYDTWARVVVIATGVRYRLQRQLGLGVPTDFLRAAQAHVPMDGSGPTTVYVGQAVAPGGFAWVVPLHKGLCRVGLMTEGNARHHFERLIHRLGLAGAEKPTVSFKPIAQGLVAKTHASRAIAVGEAAGQVKTTTGGGIYYGLCGAEIAAEVISRALRRGDVSSGAMREYERRWKLLMGREIKLGYWARRTASRLSDTTIEKLIQIVQGDGVFAFAERHARFDWHREMISYLLQMPAVRKLVLRSAAG